jgi:hypothetical protein
MLEAKPCAKTTSTDNQTSHAAEEDARVLALLQGSTSDLMRDLTADLRQASVTAKVHRCFFSWKVLATARLLPVYLDRAVSDPGLGFSESDKTVFKTRAENIYDIKIELAKNIIRSGGCWASTQHEVETIMLASSARMHLTARRLASDEFNRQLFIP